jgi:tRNA(Ile)-lysidine synthase
VAYCQEHSLRPITDESNSDPAYFRNRLRHELLPLLAAYNPHVGERLQSLAEITAADYHLLEKLAARAWSRLAPRSGPGWLQLDRRHWLSLPLSLRRATLRRAVCALEPGPNELGWRALEQARRVAEAGAVGAQSGLPTGVTLTVGYQWLHVARGPLPPGDWPQLVDEQPRPLAVPGAVTLAHGWRLEVNAIEPRENLVESAKPFQVFLDAKVAHDLTVRPRQPGERFQPLGMRGASASVKELMINQKIPANARRLWPIVATPDHLVWIAGSHLDERARLTAATRQVVALRIVPPADAE